MRISDVDRLGFIPPQLLMAAGSVGKSALSAVGGLFSSQSQSRKMRAALEQQAAARAAQPKFDYMKYAIFGVPALLLLLILKKRKKPDDIKYVIAAK